MSKDPLHQVTLKDGMRQAWPRWKRESLIIAVDTVAGAADSGEIRGEGVFSPRNSGAVAVEEDSP
jgi:hypothetical protein